MRIRPRTLFAALAALGALAFALALPGTRPAPTASAAGCVPPKPHAAGSTIETVVSSAVTREYILHVPPSYNGSDRVPVVFSFHGLGSSAAAQELYSELSARADAEDGGFIAVYPQGTPGAGGSRFWNITDQAPPSPQDVQFTSDMLDELETDLCIDTSRVFSSGMSNGAQMSVRLACSLSDRIAAVAPVAGAYYPPAFVAAPEETCPDTRAVPMIAFHGTADTTVPWAGGPGIFGVLFRLPIDNDTPDDDVMQAWSVHNGCVSGRGESTVASDVRLITYDGCVDDATTQLYAVDGGGHTWPGALPADEIDATDLLWAFFQQHPMPAAAPAPDSDGDTVPDPSDPDNDNDGCTDVQEAGVNVALGGLRSHKNFWDYADMPVLSMNPIRDKRVRSADVLAVVERYFTDDAGGTATINRNSNPLSVPPANGYHPAFDRTLVGPNPWNLGPPDGLVRVEDVLYVVDQYFNDCA